MNAEPSALDSLADIDRVAFAFEVLSEHQFARGGGWQTFCIQCHATPAEHTSCSLSRWLDETAALLDQAAPFEPEPYIPDGEPVELRGGPGHGQRVHFNAYRLTALAYDGDRLREVSYQITNQRNEAGQRIARPQREETKR